MTNPAKDIRILKTQYLRGPNIWTYRPVIEAWLDIGAFEEFPSNKLEGLYERLTQLLPGLVQHRCGVGEIGGFLERLRDGTWVGHILEHVVLELQNLAGMKTGFGQTRSTDEYGIYKMAFRTRHELVGKRALEYGRELLLAMIANHPFDLEVCLNELIDLVDTHCLGPSTNHIVEAAVDRRIPWIRLTEGNLVQLGYGKAQRRIWTAETDATSAIASNIASDKDITKDLLKTCGIPVPEGALVRSADQAWEEAQDIGLPVVIKPYDGNHGRGVSLNLMTEQDVRKAYDIAVARCGSPSVIVERFIQGDEHRLLVVGNQLIAAAKGESLWVIGDGHNTVENLVELQINTDPRRGRTEGFPLNIVCPRGKEILLDLERQGLTPDSIPQNQQKVLIQINGNVANNVTHKVHPEVARLACLATRIIGLDIAGIDLVTEDVSRPLSETRGAIIEVNSSPGLLSHIKPATGEAINVGRSIINNLFAQHETGRIPIVGVTGSAGINAISKNIATMLSMSGYYTGLANEQGVFLDSRAISKNTSDPWAASERLLINRNVEAAVFAHSAHSILSNGLNYDRCQVGVVTDCKRSDDLKAYYITEDEQMFKVVRSQVDVVLSSGTAVIHAEMEEASELAELCDGDVIMYAINENHPTLQPHLQSGKTAVLVKNNTITVKTASEEMAIMPVPSSSSPEAISIMLASVASAFSLGLSKDLMIAAMRKNE